MKKLIKILLALSAFPFIMASEVDNAELVITSSYVKRCRIYGPSPILEKYVKNGSLKLSLLELESGERTRHIYSTKANAKEISAYRELNDLNSVNFFLKNEFNETIKTKEFLSSTAISHAFCNFFGDRTSFVIDDNFVYQYKTEYLSRLNNGSLGYYLNTSKIPSKEDVEKAISIVNDNLQANKGLINGEQWELRFCVFKNSFTCIESWSFNGTLNPFKIQSFSQKIVVEPKGVLPFFTE